MSQNALLDRGTNEEVVPPKGAALLTTLPAPVARARREHLTLIAWGQLATPAMPAFPPVRPVRRPWFGLYEAGVALLMLGAGGSALFLLTRLG